MVHKYNEPIKRLIDRTMKIEKQVESKDIEVKKFHKGCEVSTKDKK